METSKLNFLLSIRNICLFIIANMRRQLSHFRAIFPSYNCILFVTFQFMLIMKIREILRYFQIADTRKKHHIKKGNC